MTPRMVKIGSETAYDALEDALDGVVRLCSSPSTLEEVAQAQGTKDFTALEKKLDRLMRAGILHKDGDRYQAAASVVYAERREGVISIVSRIVLPNLLRMVQAGQGVALQMDLHIAEKEQRLLRPRLIEALAQDLSRISDEPAADKVPCTLLALGTSDVPPADELQNRLIETLRRTSRQRAIPDQADRAFILQYDAHFAPATLERAEAWVRNVAQDLKEQTDSGKPNYTVALGFCIRNDGGVK